MSSSFVQMVLTLLVLAAALVLLWAYLRLQDKYQDALRLIPERKSPEQQQDERLNRQFEAVTRNGVTFSSSRVMGRGEYELFRNALFATGQQMPRGGYYVFPQVALGQIIRTNVRNAWQADQAHRAINSKRCDLLLADRNGNPVAVLEYQGSGHDIGGTAKRRDEIKQIALERAGVRYIEIADGTAPAEMQRIIREIVTPARIA